MNISEPVVSVGKWREIEGLLALQAAKPKRTKYRLQLSKTGYEPVSR